MLRDPSLIQFHYLEEQRKDNIDHYMVGLLKDGHDFIMSNFACTPRQPDDGPIGSGRAAQGIYYQRLYRCHDENMFVNIFVGIIGKNNSLSAILSEGTPYSLISYGPVGTVGESFAKNLFRTIKPKLRSNWFTVFNGENANRQWRVFVAQGDTLIEYPLPQGM